MIEIAVLPGIEYIIFCMSTQVSSLLVRFGIVFDFFAFFMASPEILGEVRLKRIQKYLRVILWWTSVVFFGLAVVGGVIFILAGTLLPLIFTFFWGPLYRNGSIILILFSGVLSAGLSWLALKLMHLVERLTQNRKMRRQFLHIGIGLVVLSAILQIVGTF